jgi:hypothetical protein
LTPILLALFLQAGGAESFIRYLREAQERLQIAPAPLAVVDHGSRVAWVPYGPEAPYGPVFARREFLRRAAPGILRITAYHESCHLYIGTNRRSYLHNEEDLQHLMIDGCVEHLLGRDYEYVMNTIPCGPFFPLQVVRYMKLTRKERCVEKR